MLRDYSYPTKGTTFELTKICRKTRGLTHISIPMDEFFWQMMETHTIDDILNEPDKYEYHCDIHIDLTEIH